MLGHLNKLYTVDIQRKVSSMIIFKRCSSLESSIICHFDVKGTNPLKKSETAALSQPQYDMLLRLQNKVSFKDTRHGMTKSETTKLHNIIQYKTCK